MKYTRNKTSCMFMQNCNASLFYSFQVSPEDEYTDLFDTGAVNSQPPESYRPLPL